MIDLRLGDFREVLAAEEWDTTIVDAPYGPRTHTASDDLDTRKGSGKGDGGERSPISYAAWSSIHVAEAVNFLAPRTRGWIVSLTDTELMPAWMDCLAAAGRYVFAPLPFVDVGSRVRLQGDGPSSWTVWVVVARPKSRVFAKWGTLPGAYIRNPGDPRSPHIGGKPLGMMREIVRDYSRPGDLVCDPCAGAGTTLAAAILEGRRALGAEIDADTYALARRRLLAEEPSTAAQRGLF